MAARKDVYNITRGFWMKRSQAEKAIRECSMAWDEEGSTVRSLSLQEAYDARVAQAARREQLATPLPYGELPGFLFQPPVSGTIAARASRRLMWEAHKFAAGASAAFTG